jgi:hypothetical protein
MSDPKPIDQAVATVAPGPAAVRAFDAHYVQRKLAERPFPHGLNLSVRLPRPVVSRHI